MAGFDEKCPHCSAKIDCQAAWQNSDHQHDFKFTCGECDGIVSITVHMVPEFETSKPECLWCHKTTDGTRDYCPTCMEKLRKLSEHNSKKNEAK